MQDILGLIGIAIAFFMVIYLSYKGMNLVYVIVAACFVVIVTNGLPVIDTFEQVIYEWHWRAGCKSDGGISVRRTVWKSIH